MPMSNSTVGTLPSCGHTAGILDHHIYPFMAVESQSWTMDVSRLKLLELGKLCGLMPKSTPSSQQIHLVVELSVGIQDDEEEEEQTADIHEGVSRLAVSEPPSVMAVKRKQHPVEKLKEALSSKKAFQKCYLVRRHILST